MLVQFLSLFHQPDSGIMQLKGEGSYFDQFIYTINPTQFLCLDGMYTSKIKLFTSACN